MCHSQLSLATYPPPTCRDTHSYNPGARTGLLHDKARFSCQLEQSTGLVVQLAYIPLLLQSAQQASTPSQTLRELLFHLPIFHHGEDRLSWSEHTHTGPAVQLTDIPLLFQSTSDLHSISNTTLLRLPVFHPSEDRRLSWPEHTHTGPAVQLTDIPLLFQSGLHSISNTTLLRLPVFQPSEDRRLSWPHWTRGAVDRHTTAVPVRPPPV